MNTFAENPLLFFMDNMPPIISVKTPKDIRKIVELSDTGCDARLTTPNCNGCYFPKLYKVKSNKNWTLDDEAKIDDSCGGRYRILSRRSALDIEDYHLDHKNHGTNQYWWPGHAQYEDTVNDGELERNLESKDFKSKLKMTSQKARAYRWRRDSSPCDILSNAGYHNYHITPQNIPKNVNVATKDRLLRSIPRRSKIAGIGSKIDRADNPTKDLKANVQDIVSGRSNEIHLELDYPEDFETNEILRNSSRNYKDHLCTLNSAPYDGIRNPIDVGSRKNDRMSKYNWRNIKSSKSPKSVDPPKDWDNSADSRIRSRTRSPPTDRRKRPQSFPKPGHENANQYKNQRDDIEPVVEIVRASNDAEYLQKRSTNSVHSMKKLKPFMDRAMDKDSSSDALNASTSTERFRRSPVLDRMARDTDETGYIRTSFWEFIPLDTEEDREYKSSLTNKNPAYERQTQQSLGDYSDEPMKRLYKDCIVDSRMKSVSVQKGMADEEADRSGPSPDSDPGNDSLASATPQVKAETVQAADVQPKPNVAETLKGQEHRRRESRSQSKITVNYFGHLRKPSSYMKSESNGDKKKELTNHADGFSVADEQKGKSNIVERAAACMKRKLDKSRTEEGLATLNQSSTTPTEKKTRPLVSACSRLPIRIGSRRVSKAPVAVKRPDAKTCAAKDEAKRAEFKESSDNPDERLSSARSRTKSRVKPSVLQDKDTVNRVDAPEHVQSTVAEQWLGDTKDRTEGDSAEKSSLLKKPASNSLIDCADASVEINPSTVTFLNGEKFLTSTEDRGIDPMEAFDTTEDQRRKYTANHNYGQKMCPRDVSKKPTDPGVRSGFKGKCCFHVNNAENMVCNSYYDKERKRLDSFRNRKPIAITSRY